MNYAQEDAIRELVKEQGEDQSLWAKPEGYRETHLQAELLKLHAMIDGEDEQLWNNK